MDYDSGEVYVNPNKKLGLISQIPRFPEGFTVEDVLRSAFAEILRVRQKMELLECEMANGESKIDKIVAIVEDGSVGAPCGACREYMMQLDKDSGDIEILIDYVTRKTVRLKELIPEWWGSVRFN